MVFYELSGCGFKSRCSHLNFHLIYLGICKSGLYSLDESTDLEPNNFRLLTSLSILNDDCISRKSMNFYQVRQAHVKHREL